MFSIYFSCWETSDVEFFFFCPEKNNAKKTVKTMKHEKRGRKVSKERKFGRLQKRAANGVEKHGERVKERKS